MGSKKINIRRLTLIALFTAIVAVMQLLGGFIKFGQFSVTLVLVPIVVGAAMCGVATGAWLGCVFGLMVFATGDAAAFLAIDPVGTIVTVMLKGILAGLAAGLTYKLLSRINRYLAVFTAAIISPVVNTGIFLIGCNLFFYDTVSQWALADGKAVGAYLILVMVGANFLFEVLFNVVLSPAAVRIVDIATKKRNN